MATDFFSGVYFGSNLIQYGLFFGTLIVFIILGRIINFFLENYVKKFTAKTETELDDLLLEAAQKPIMFISVILGAFLGSNFFLTLPPEMNATFSNILGLLIIVDVAWFLINIVDGIIQHIIVPFTKKTKTKMDDQLIPIVSKVLKAAIVAMSFIIILDNFGYDITTLIAGLGIGGLAVAFAAQQTIADAFGGINIFLSKPFFVGDTIEVEGLKGTVEYIGIRHTHLRDFDGRINIISNSKISTAIVKNRTSEPGRKVRINLGVTYATPVKKLKQGMEIVKTILAKRKNIDQPSIVVGFTEFKDFSLNIFVMFYVKEKTYSKIVETKNSINLEIKAQFEKNKIEFAYPTQTIYLAK